MIKALLLILRPVPTLEGIVRARQGLAFILAIYLLPLLVLSSAGEGYGLHHWGKTRTDFGPPQRFTLGETVVFEAGQVLLSLVVILVGAKLIKSVGETFHGRHTYTQAFTTVVYGLAPLFLFRLLDALPNLSPWIPWGAGILFSIGVLYHGVPRIMQPDPPNAFGLFLMSAFLLLLTTGLARFVTAWYLQGKFDKLERLISGLAAKLPF